MHRFLSRNRTQKRAYYEEGKHGTQTRQSAHPAKFRHLLRATEATSRFPERDTLILLLGVTCGKRITEIARVEVHHVLSRRGTRQEEISLPGQMTKGCRPRCVFLSHPRLIQTQKGGAFEPSVKRRVNFAGESIEYLAADSLQNYITSLYRAAGLGRGFSSHSGRRTFASRLVTQGQLLETVRMLLGH
ncbi:site-specific integrase [Paraburkholderia guartelaensis]|uniref:Site-specific integrase n=1 Tax=Paraburkholderia guartelaensis TaxID=2546446 RepID=A0A4R5LAE6_9BURK|nr:site-specific integrase [Paraburkholderia guartelaensis]